MDLGNWFPSMQVRNLMMIEFLPKSSLPITFLPFSQTLVDLCLVPLFHRARVKRVNYLRGALNNVRWPQLFIRPG